MKEEEKEEAKGKKNTGGDDYDKCREEEYHIVNHLRVDTRREKTLR